jgi:predicted CoA-binding protein
MSEVREVLEKYSVVAVVGISTNPAKASHRIPRILKDAGFKIIPVNPTGDEVLGQKTYPTLAAIPHQVDVVDVFRPSDEAADIARQAVEIGAKALWLQIGITSDEARAIAEDAGLDFVENRCMGSEARALGITKH